MMNNTLTKVLKVFFILKAKEIKEMFLNNWAIVTLYALLISWVICLNLGDKSTSLLMQFIYWYSIAIICVGFVLLLITAIGWGYLYLL